MRPNPTPLLALTLALTAACSPGAGEEFAHAAVEAEFVAEEIAPAATFFPTPEEWSALHHEIEATVSSIDSALRRVPNLRGAEQARLRADVNAVQTARARQLGIPRPPDVQALLASGRLVEIADSTELWVLRNLTHSKPYVTPDTHTMLVELGERFHRLLAEEDLPPFRMEITSVLRLPEHQASLRRSNPNAAAGVSAHEYGTTVDIAYRRFSPPAAWSPPVEGEIDPVAEERLRQIRDLLLVETATQRGTELQAVLGRAVLEMRAENKLLVMMERQQTVYHMTVARRFQ